MSSTYPFTAEQIEIQNLARDFARREILPFSHIYEKEDIVKSQLPEKICQSGLVNGRIPAKFGGLGLTLFDTGLIAKELAFACIGITSLVQASELAITILLIAGKEEQKEVYLAPLAKTGLAGIALPLNSRQGFDNNLIVSEESDSIILNGFCPLVLNASLSAWFIVGCSAGYFIVPRDSAGLTFSDNTRFLGCRAADIRKVDFNNVRLQPICKISMSASGHENISVEHSAIIAAGSIGLAQAAFDQAKNYAQQRKTFGVPIASHQAIAFLLANMNTDIEAASLMIYQPICSQVNGNYSAKLSKCAQSFALEMAGRVTIDSVQIFGGYGYTKDYPVEKLMRDARTYQSFYGTSCALKEELGQALLSIDI